MPYLQLNGYTLPIGPGTDVQEVKTKGSRTRSRQGRLADKTRSHKREWRLRIVCQERREAEATRALIRGEFFHGIWDGRFNVGGLNATAGHDGDLDISSGVFDSSLVVASAGSVGYPAKLGDEWTVLVRVQESDSTEKFLALRSDNAQWLDGVEALATGVDNSVSVSSAGVVSLNGITPDNTAQDTVYSELIILPFFATTKMIAAFTASSLVFSDGPRVHLTGDFVQDPGGIVVRGQLADAPFLSLAPRDDERGRNDGFRESDVHVNVVVKEIEPLPCPVIIAEELGRYIEATRFRGTYTAGTPAASNPIVLTAGAAADHAAISKYGVGEEPDWSAKIEPLGANDDIEEVHAVTKIGGGMTVAAFRQFGGSLSVEIYNGSTASTPGTLHATISGAGSTNHMSALVGYNVDGSVSWVKELGHTGVPGISTTGWVIKDVTMSRDGATYKAVGYYTWGNATEPDPLVDTLTHANISGGVVSTASVVLTGNVSDGTVTKATWDFLDTKVGTILAQNLQVAHPNAAGIFATAGFWEHTSDTDDPALKVDEGDATSADIPRSNRLGTNNYAVRRLASGVRDYVMSTQDAANTNDDGRETGSHIDAAGRLYRSGVVDPNGSAVRLDERFPTPLSSPPVQDSSVKYLLQAHEINGDPKYQAQVNLNVGSAAGTSIGVHVDEVNDAAFFVVDHRAGNSPTLTFDPFGVADTIALAAIGRTALGLYVASSGAYLDSRQLLLSAGTQEMTPVSSITPRTGPQAGRLVLGLTWDATVDAVLDIGDGVTFVPRPTGGIANGVAVAQFDRNGSALRALSVVGLSTFTAATTGRTSGQIQASLRTF